MSSPIPAPDPAPARHTARPLPPRRYVPGRDPHPFRNPEGHTWQGGAAPVAPPWAPGPWADDEPFLHGVDLFNHRFVWEAHEVWEGLWRQAPPDAPHRPLLQGLIQLAAWLLKRHMGDAGSADRLREAAMRHLGEARARGGDVVHGVALETVAAGVAQAAAHGDWLLLRVPGKPPLRVVAAVWVEEGRVLAALRPPHVARGGLWELPGGKVEAGESDQAALERELQEELGVTVEAGPAVAEAVYDYGDVCVRLVAVPCRLRSGVPAAREHDALRWLDAAGLDAVTWAPADLPLLPTVRAMLLGTGG